MKRFLQYLTQAGGKPYHAVWVKYYSHTSEPIKPIPGQTVPFDQLFDFFKYTPPPEKLVIETIRKCKSSDDLDTELSNLFKFGQNNFLNFLIIVRDSLNQQFQSSKSKNASLIPDTFLRFTIALSYQLKFLIRDVANTNFPSLCWDSLHFIVIYGMQVSQEYYDDFQLIIQNIFDVFLENTDIQKLPNDSPILKSFITITNIVLPFIANDIDHSNKIVHEFVIKAFYQFTGKLDRTTLVKNSKMMLHLISHNINTLDHSLLYQSTILLNDLIMHFIEPDQKLSQETIDFCFECFPLILKCSSQLNVGVPNEIAKSVIAFSLGLLMTFDCDLDYTPQLEKIPKLKFYNSEELETYLHESPILPPLTEIKFKELTISRFIDWFSSFLIVLSNDINGFIDTFISTSAESQNNQKFIYLVFLVSIIKMTKIESYRSYKKLLLSSAFEDIYKENSVNYVTILFCTLIRIEIIERDSIEFALEIADDISKRCGIDSIKSILTFGRSALLQENKIDFIRYFVDSNLLDDIQSLALPQFEVHIEICDMVVQFYQIIAVFDLNLTLSSKKFCQVIKEMAVQKRYQNVLTPCFKKGLECDNVVLNITDQIMTIVNHAKTHENYIAFATKLVKYLANNIHRFPSQMQEQFHDIIDFKSIMQLSQVSKDQKNYEYTIKLINEACIKFRLVRNEIHRTKGSLRELMFPIEINEKILKQLKCLVVMTNEIDHEQCLLMQSDASLELLILRMKHSPYELNVLEFLINLCSNSLTNIYRCYLSDIIGLCLNRSRISAFESLAMSLFKMIGSYYFSIYCLKETLHAFNLSSIGRRLKYHSVLLNSVYSLICDETQKIPVRSYFHFHIGTNKTGIFNYKISLPYKFSIKFAFRLENTPQLHAPLLHIENSSHKLVVYIENERVVTEINGEKFVAQFPVSKNIWYEYMFLMRSIKSFRTGVDGRFTKKLELETKLDLSSSHMSFGTDLVTGFKGDFGPIEVYKTGKTTKINESNLITCFHPADVNDHLVNGSKCIATSITNISTLSDVLKLNGIFHLFIPLLLLINYSKDDVDNQKFFHTLLTIFCLLFKHSEENEESCLSFGGFQLILGIISQVKFSSYDAQICQDFEDIFSSLKNEELKTQMIENFWLNFRFVIVLPFSFQKKFFSESLPNVFHSVPQYFTLYSIDYVYHQIIFFYSISKLEQPFILFPNVDINGKNKITCLNITSQQIIRNNQWEFFYELLILNASPTIFMAIYMTIIGHDGEFSRKKALELYELALSRKDNISIMALKAVKGYESFLVLLKSDVIETQIKAINCIYYIGKLEEIYHISQMTLEQAIIHATTLMTDNSSQEFFEICFKHLYDVESINFEEVNSAVYPEFLPLIFGLALSFDMEFLQPFTDKLINSLTKYPESFHKLFNNKYWVWYFFIFLKHVYPADEQQSNICSIFGVILHYLLLINDFDSVRMYFYFLELLSITNNNVNILAYKYMVLKDLLALVFKKVPSHDSLLFLVALVTNIIFYSRDAEENESSTITIESIINVKEQIKTFDIDSHRDKMNFVYSFNPKDPNQLEIVYKVCLLLSTLSMDGSVTIKPNHSFNINLFVLHCFLVSATLKENENANKNDLIKTLSDSLRIGTIDATLGNTVVKQGFSVAYDLATMFSIEVSASVYEDFLNDIKNQSSNLTSEITKRFDSIIEILSLASDHSITPNEFTNVETCKQFLVNFNQAHATTGEMVLFHSKKLAKLFIREVSMNGGPWSTTTADFKWKTIAKCDKYGQNIFMKINRKYDDHKHASANRDQIQMDTTEQVNKEDPFKRILGLNVKYLPSKINESITSLASFTVLYRTLTYQCPGTIYIMRNEIYFSGKIEFDGFGTPLKEKSQKLEKHITILDKDIGFIFRRTFLHEDIAAEIFTSVRKMHLFNFQTKEKRNEFLLKAKEVFKPNDFRSNRYSGTFTELHSVCGGIAQTIDSKKIISKANFTDRWLRHDISNFQYIFVLNALSGRSLNDLTQYPIYPWVIADYKSSSLDLNDPKTFRDITKPIGALNEERLQKLISLYNEIEDSDEKCMYRTFYSTPAYVINYLIRTEPFSTLHITLQSDKYDKADRLFSSIPKTWELITSMFPDYRELTPEFFCAPSFLSNKNGFDLGKTQDGKSINDVELPPWAASPYTYVQINRQALESDYIRENLHHWIDMIYGCYQNSSEKFNVFHKFCNPETLQAADTEEKVVLIKHHCANFGTVPCQLFSDPHPACKLSNKISSISIPNNFSTYQIEGDIRFFSKRVLVTHNHVIKLNSQTITSCQLPCLVSKTDLIDVTDQNKIIIIRKNSNKITVYSFDGSTAVEFCSQKLHNSLMSSCVRAVSNEMLLTGSKDCIVYLWSLADLSLISFNSHHSFPVTTIDGELAYDLIVSIDSRHTVFYTVLSSQKFIRTFHLNCESRDEHQIYITRTGVVIITSSNAESKKGVVMFFDLFGEEIARVETESHIESIDVSYPKKSSGFAVISTRSKVIHVVDMTFFKVVSKITDYIFPMFICAVENSRAVIAVKQNQMKFNQYEY